MRIYRLTYEEIDTEDKSNPAKNIRIMSQQTLSEYELSNISPFAIEGVKQKILKEIINKI